MEHVWFTFSCIICLRVYWSLDLFKRIISSKHFEFLRGARPAGGGRGLALVWGSLKFYQNIHSELVVIVFVRNILIWFPVCKYALALIHLAVVWVVFEYVVPIASCCCSNGLLVGEGTEKNIGQQFYLLLKRAYTFDRIPFGGVLKLYHALNVKRH